MVTKSIPEREPEVEQNVEDLNINDLNALKQIIEVSNSRATFKASELEAVGKVYNRLSRFLDQSKGTDND